MGPDKPLASVAEVAALERAAASYGTHLRGEKRTFSMFSSSTGPSPWFMRDSVGGPNDNPPTPSFLTVRGFSFFARDEL